VPFDKNTNGVYYYGITSRTEKIIDETTNEKKRFFFIWEARENEKRVRQRRRQEKIVLFRFDGNNKLPMIHIKYPSRGRWFGAKAELVILIYGVRFSPEVETVKIYCAKLRRFFRMR
jgi:hypothetical protein